jgi:hypothetical protein
MWPPCIPLARYSGRGLGEGGVQHTAQRASDPSHARHIAPRLPVRSDTIASRIVLALQP